MMDHNTAMDAIVAVCTFGNTAIGAALLIRQSFIARRQVRMHLQNQEAIADVKQTMIEVHK